jgi:hypothetical protein
VSTAKAHKKMENGTSPLKVRPLWKGDELHCTVQPMVLLLLPQIPIMKRVTQTRRQGRDRVPTESALRESHDRKGLKQPILMASETAIALIPQGIEQQRGQ